MSGKECPQCHTKNNSLDNFCRKCGSKFAPNGIVCSKCHKINPPTAKLCIFCGNELSGYPFSMKFLRDRFRGAEKTFKEIAELADNDKGALIERMCFDISAAYRIGVEDLRDCLDGADIKSNKKQGREVRTYAFIVVIKDGKWDKLNRILRDMPGESTGGFALPLSNSIFGNVGGLIFVQHKYKDTHIVTHEIRHNSFFVYHSGFLEGNEKLSHYLLNELNSRRENVEAGEMTWSQVADELCGYFVKELKETEKEIFNGLKIVYKEISDRMKSSGSHREILEAYIQKFPDKSAVVQHFLGLMVNACSATEELEKRYDKWVVDRFMIRCRDLEDVVNWREKEPELNKLQARQWKERSHEIQQLKQEISEKKEHEMEELREEIGGKREKEMNDLRERIRKDKEKGRFK